MTALTAAPITEAAQPRARGAVRLSAKLRGKASVIDDLSMSGSLKCLFPRTFADHLDAMLINTAGGVTGGDRFFLEARAGEGTTLTLTTQAAERAYAARGEAPGRVETMLTAGAGARLNWLPQETILFNEMNFARRLTVDLADDARFLMVEPLVLGRVAMGEELCEGRFMDRVTIRRGGVPLYADGVNLSGDIAGHMASRATMGGARAMAALVLVGPEAAAMLDRLRALMPGTGGASLLADDILVARVVAPDGWRLRQVIVPAIRLLNDDEIPRPWML
ncbi:urease accessory protein UreD [Maritimibacter sp. DP1N21-5]|uniref:urease accessory protein UreD n=1 Tax=Maritimibacter sp. DP1N21-5 TaxID=2836867 RepID=UPI001C484EA6|nr:urease accessory protein UreD [Maritimibacter sp. DP1N21-5]MBV7408517.1 urease accessory protein UreD [Maritimibacter sp. DP1N21-5]